MYTIDFTFIPDWEDYEALINTPPPLENELPAFLPSLNSDHPLILLPPPSPPQTKERKRKIRYGHNTNELKCVAGTLIRRFKQQEALNKFKEEIGCTGKHICTKGLLMFCWKGRAELRKLCFDERFRDLGTRSRCKCSCALPDFEYIYQVTTHKKLDDKR